jgi:uncharacterized protein YeaO (DUF488 family)
MKHDIEVKRVYAAAGKDDGARVLVDRVWPRGVSKAKAKADGWLKEVAPSTKLRKWFGHDPAKWTEFKKRYFAELKEAKEAVGELRALAKRGKVTLLFGAKDEEHNQAVALREFLMKSRRA